MARLDSDPAEAPGLSRFSTVACKGPAKASHSRLAVASPPAALLLLVRGHTGMRPPQADAVLPAQVSLLRRLCPQIAVRCVRSLPRGFAHVSLLHGALTPTPRLMLRPARPPVLLIFLPWLNSLIFLEHFTF